jgi:predicted metalloendopeptidase
MKDWWTADDLKRFEERVSLIVNQYDSYVVAGDTHLKGKLVSGEAAADLGGMTIAYKALERSLDGKPRLPDSTGFTPEQRFFISFAQGWCTNLRPQYERLMANTNPHPTPHLRVNGTLGNMDSFEKAFELKDDSPMMLPPDKRCRLW